MIPRTGRRHNLNKNTQYYPMTMPEADDDSPTVPTLIIGGVRVSVYADTEGTLCISVNTDEEAPDPRFDLDYDNELAVPLAFSVNGTPVYEMRH